MFAHDLLAALVLSLCSQEFPRTHLSTQISFAVAVAAVAAGFIAVMKLSHSFAVSSMKQLGSVRVWLECSPQRIFLEARSAL